MPSNMIINTESVTGFNNKLMKASSDMNFGVNNSINTEAKQVGIKHNMGSSKVKLPHRTETKPKPSTKTDSTQTYSMRSDSTQHEKNILAFIVVAGGLAWYLFR